MPEWTLDGTLEFQSKDAIRDAQNVALRKHLHYVATHSPFYMRRFAELGISDDDCLTVEDLRKLPLTTKADLEENNDDLLCVSETEIRDLCQTSGTTGKPVVLMQTASDLERLAYNEALSFQGCGITVEDRLIIACSLGRNFMAGIAYYLGAVALGATAIRTGSDSMPLIMDSINRHKPTALVAVPSMAAAMAERFKADGTDPATLGLRRILCIGEPIRNDDLTLSPLGEKVSNAWGASVYGTYASTEMATAFCDCDAGQGGHLHPDLVVIELLDERGKPVAPGEIGEVVATPLGITGMPVLRLRTGDVCRMHDTPCPCGRNSIRLGPILGRRSQMLKVRGCTIYPPAIFNALQTMPEIECCYVEVYCDFELSDRLRVVVGTSDDSVTAENVAARIAALTRVKPEVDVQSVAAVRAKTFIKEKRKPQRFFDYRNNPNLETNECPKDAQ